MGGRASSESKNKYNEKAYDRIALFVPKGKKALLQALAKEQGESLNGFINKAIDFMIEQRGITSE